MSPVSHGSFKSDLRNVATGLVTPFDDDLAIDHHALGANAQALYDGGIRLFFACGNISEYHSLTHAERKRITETSVDALPADATVLAGIGGSIESAVDLAEAATAAGVDGLMVMPPDHTFKHEEGLLTYYRRIGAETTRPLVPYLRRFNPSASFVAALSRLEAVAGIKWAIEDIPKFGAARAAGSDDIVWLNGLGERHAIPLYAEGARGMASGIGNFEPAVGTELFAALEADDFDRARRILDVARPYMAFRERPGENNTLAGGLSVPGVKAGLDFAGLTGGRVRPPLVELQDSERTTARELYDDLAAVIDDL